MFATETHVQVEATWGIYQRKINAYRDEDRIYIARSRLETGGFRLHTPLIMKSRLHPGIQGPRQRGAGTLRPSLRRVRPEMCLIQDLLNVLPDGASPCGRASGQITSGQYVALPLQ
ncbi:hypothetical protein E3O55_15450 [Cryobacterium sp. MDB1-18-2]|nr:hypothetical protein E3O55_15450 [Cryobacterium sp. MDB1-18-2]TFC42060.1 hypothetical protein E3O50_09210 [Cryobacterium sp. MDB1-18-1]